MNQGCSDSQPCCPGSGCFNSTCVCSNEHDGCGQPGQICCGGLTCDPTGHCVQPCTDPVGACEPFGGKCTGDSDCCGQGKCSNGKCGDPTTGITCGLEGTSCTTSATCCGSADAGPGSQLECWAATDGGGGRCHLGIAGEVCDPTHHCDPLLTCILPVYDAGTPVIPDAGTPDAGSTDAGDNDAGDVDAGDLADAGDATDAGLDAGFVFDAGTVGVCGVVTHGVCNLTTATCLAGATCNPNSSANQGYDPCYYKASGGSLALRANGAMSCNNGYCTAPIALQPCVSACTQTPGDPLKTACITSYDGSKICEPTCATDTDCQGATVYDQQLYNPQPVTNYCVKYAAKSGCQPLLCFFEGDAKLGDVSVLYQPCANKPDSLCLPRFDGSLSNIVGFCTATRPNAPASTVGDACDIHAGTEASAATCGPDAICLGGRCAAICDASQLGDNNTPACDTSHTCISPQNVDLVADYQFGGCGNPCDPFADLEHSGCVSYCGGSPARCDWLIGDPAPGASAGYCGAAVKEPLTAGTACTTGALDPCEAGARCLLSSDGVTRTCTKLCDPTMDAGPDTCPGSQKCTSFDPLKRSGYCQ